MPGCTLQYLSIVLMLRILFILSRDKTTPFFFGIDPPVLPVPLPLGEIVILFS